MRETRVMLRGRERETQVLGELIAGARDGQGGALVVRGEAGIGKTSLLEWTAESAAGFRALRAAGAEFEMELAFAGLHALCAPLLGARERLPGPQREALDAAFGLRSADPPDPLRTGMAVLTLLSDAAEERPVICVVDDAQWLDRASAQALAFAARRIGSDAVAMVFGVREPLVPSELVAMPALPVGGLADAEARALLIEVLPVRLDEQVVDRILAEARGNPLALRELAVDGPPGQLAGGFAVSLPARPDRDLFRRRVAGLSPDARLLLLVAAAEPLGDPLLLWNAAEQLGLPREAAEPAETARLVEIGSRVRFHHPLVRSSVYRSASAEDRRRAHAALAAVTDERVDPDRRAWHRAQAAQGPDEDVAAELARSADRARARGGMAAAAAFLQRVVELTPDAALRADRALVAAQALLGAGDPGAASEVVRIAESGVQDELSAAHVDRLRGEIAFVATRGPDGPALLRRAAQQLEPLDIRAARDAHLEALFATLATGSLEDRAVEAAAAALAAAPAPDPGVPDLLLDGMARVLAGERPAGAAMLKRALAGSPAEMLAVLPQFVLLACLEVWDVEALTSVLTYRIEKARAGGEVTLLTQALGPLALAYLPQGRLRAAAALLEEADALAAGVGMPPVYPRVQLAALRGDADDARALFHEVTADATARGEGLLVRYTAYCDAMLHNALGQYAAAREALARVPTLFAGLPQRELVEAAVRTGDRAIAGDAFGQLRECTAAAGTPWALGVQASCSALLGDGAEADARHRDALRHLERSGCRVDECRARLLYGEWLRREGQRVDARAQLRAAHEGFAAMGANAFAERALQELRATGERARRRTPDTIDELTPQEVHIARLVGEGATSKEVAAELFVSPRTVDAHLRNIFRKLDITSRRQLRGRQLPSQVADTGEVLLGERHR
jgi:DNA-binding CsgD family transcriptional regulator